MLQLHLVKHIHPVRLVLGYATGLYFIRYTDDESQKHLRRFAKFKDPQKVHT